MEVLGYSERGAINSLFYEIKYSINNLKILKELLSRVSFPYRNVNFEISGAKILIEQSFSDFGDSDAVVLIESKSKKKAIFIEAKVSAFKKWAISGEFKTFIKTSDEIVEKIMRNGDDQEIKKLKGKIRSNLFMQMYSKTRMIKALQTDDMMQLQEGIQFPKVSSKEYRKIGNNKVVLKAVNQLKLYCKGAFFVALVPEKPSRLMHFYQNILKDYNLKSYQEWDVECWGYISWLEVEDFCKSHGLKETLKIFEFNGGQIYKNVPKHPNTA